MRHLAAYLMLVLAGNASPSAEDVTKVLGSAGVEADEERLSALFASLKDKDLAALIAEGTSKLSAVPSGARGAAPAAAAGGAAAKEDAPAAKEEPESESESDEDMGGGLFGDESD